MPSAAGQSPEERRQNLRMAEALLFASAEPLSAEEIAGRLPEGADVAGLLRELQEAYAGRGVSLTQVAGKWSFRTAGDLSLPAGAGGGRAEALSRAGLETLAIVAYHQPVTRADIEEIRGVATSTGTLDMLLEVGWIRIARPAEDARPADHLRHDGRLPVALRPRFGIGPPRRRRA